MPMSKQYGRVVYGFVLATWVDRSCIGLYDVNIVRVASRPLALDHLTSRPWALDHVVTNWSWPLDYVTGRPWTLDHEADRPWALDHVTSKPWALDHVSVLLHIISFWKLSSCACRKVTERKLRKEIEMTHISKLSGDDSVFIPLSRERNHHNSSLGLMSVVNGRWALFALNTLQLWVKDYGREGMTSLLGYRESRAVTSEKCATCYEMTRVCVPFSNHEHAVSLCILFGLHIAIPNPCNNSVATVYHFLTLVPSAIGYLSVTPIGSFCNCFINFSSVFLMPSVFFVADTKTHIETCQI